MWQKPFITVELMHQLIYFKTHQIYLKTCVLYFNGGNLHGLEISCFRVIDLDGYRKFFPTV